MLPESQFARQESLISNQEFSIFDFYSIANEIQFIQETELLSKEEKSYYVQENVVKFLAEFAGKAPYGRISLVLTPEGLEFAGISTSLPYRKSIERAAFMGGDASREYDEWRGYQQIEKALLGGKQGITWISPPQVGDYGLVFHFQKDPKSPLVHEYLLMYDEKLGELDNSQDLLHFLQSNIAFMNTSAFLRNPLTTCQPEITLNLLLNHLGIDQEKIERSKMLENEIRTVLGEKIKEYIGHIFSGNINDAKDVLTGLFHATKGIKKEIDSMPIEQYRYISFVGANRISPQRFTDYTRQPALVIGGGSCPVTRPGSSTPLSNYNILQGLKIGLPIEATVLNFTCPECSGNNPDKHYHCPQCNKRYADETHRSADQRTKECSCGFKFNC